jgi:hypothetical protein
VTLAVLGGASAAGAATSWWFPWVTPTTTTTTTTTTAVAPVASSDLGCPSPTDVQNLVLRSGSTYVDANSPTANISITSSRVGWTIISPSTQTRVVSFYSKAGFVTYSGKGPTSVVTSSSSLGQLGTVTICTTPGASTTSSTTPTTPPTSPTTPPTSPPSSGACPAGQVQNVVTTYGTTYLDASTPTLNVVIAGTTIVWSRVPGVTQTGGTASYQQGNTAVSPSASTIATTTSKGKLLVLVVCTTPAP